MPRTGTPISKIPGLGIGAFGWNTELGPPERMIPMTPSSRSFSGEVEKWYIVEKTWNSLIRRAMICVYCDPKSSTAIVCGMCWMGKGREERARAPDGKLEPQARVLMAAPRALAELGSLGGRVESVAADAVERGPAPLP